MSYDAPLRVSYSWSAINFGSSTSRILRGPAGKRGRVVDATANVTTLFTNVTTGARLQVGPSGTLTAALDMPFTNNAAGSALDATNVSGAIKTGTASFLAADTDQTVGFIAPTGGTPAGVADIHVTIEWF